MNNSRQFGKNVFTFVRRIEKLAVYIAAIALFSYYIACIPVNLALTLHVSVRSGFGAGASIFEGNSALKRARLRALGLKKRLSWKKTELEIEKDRAFSAAWRALRCLLRHLKLERLSAYGHICAPDAAQTALICGSFRMLEGVLRPFASPDTVRLRLEPDFSAGRSDFTICGMVSTRLGHIILAALIGAWNYISRRNAHGKASN